MERSRAVLRNSLFSLLAVGCVQGNQVVYQGHRGARGEAPENCWAAMEVALEHGVTTLELDVCLTADGVVVLSHEPWLSEEICTYASGKSLPDSAIYLKDLRYDELIQFDCGSRAHPRFPEQRKQPTSKPSFASIVRQARLWGEEKHQQIKFNVEPKTRVEWDGLVTPGYVEVLSRLLQELDALDAGPSEVTLQSFDMRALRWLHQRQVSYPLALLVEEPKNPKAEIGELGFTPAVYSPNSEYLTKEMVDVAVDLGLEVVVWTVNEPERMKELEAWGVHGIITDYPSRIRP